MAYAIVYPWHRSSMSRIRVFGTDEYSSASNACSEARVNKKRCAIGSRNNRAMSYYGAGHNTRICSMKGEW